MKFSKKLPGVEKPILILKLDSFNFFTKKSFSLWYDLTSTFPPLTTCKQQSAVDQWYMLIF